jgi:hypothetical protein
LAKNQQAQAQLREQLGQVQEQFRVERANLEARTAQLETRTAELAAVRSRSESEAQRWQKLEAELQQCIGHQTNQLSSAAAVANSKQLEIEQLQSRIEDMQIIQSALCTRIRELNARQETAASRFHDLERQSQAAKQTIQTREKELAALRHAILDGRRFGNVISRERFGLERHMVDGWKRLINTLHQTPLSITQRGVISEITGALDSWKMGSLNDRHNELFQIEVPNFQGAPFNVADVVECAFEAVRKDADGTGAAVRVATSGPIPENLNGNAEQIHQVIALLSSSLLRLALAKNLDVQVSCESKAQGIVEMHLSLLLSATNNDGNLFLGLRVLAEKSTTLGVMQGSESELAFASAWQLALALGGDPVIESTADEAILLRVSIPLEVTLPSDRANDADSGEANRAHQPDRVASQSRG